MSRHRLSWPDRDFRTARGDAGIAGTDPATQIERRTESHGAKEHVDHASGRAEESGGWGDEPGRDPEGFFGGFGGVATRNR